MLVLTWALHLVPVNVFVVPFGDLPHVRFEFRRVMLRRWCVSKDHVFVCTEVFPTTCTRVNAAVYLHAAWYVACLHARARVCVRV